MIFGMVLGYRLHDTLRGKRPIEDVVQRSDRLEEIIDLINERYVDSVDGNGLYADAIKGILSHLDPHTNYIPASELRGVNEDLSGSFFGIGVEFAIIRDTIQVTSVIEKGPAAKAGVQMGDKLIKVADTTVAGTGITTERITNMLRGKQNSPVAVTLLDPYKGASRKVTILRDKVPLVSMDAAIMLDESTGYIRLNRFASTTYAEYSDGLKNLEDRGMKSLILDLRGNPGGYLTEAAYIADDFLDDEKLIVYTEGLHSERREYRSENEGYFEQGRLVILVDEGTASASEILAAAVQDWDRGLVVGRRTYGKGLVQEQYDLNDGSALRLTIARYYAPSGRSIQRSYAKGRDAYAADNLERYYSGEFTGSDSLGIQDTLTYRTLLRGRKVYGGGGVKPDVYVQYDSLRLSNRMIAITFSEILQNVVWDYYIAHHGNWKQYRSVSDFNVRYNEEDVILQSYLQAIGSVERATANRILSRGINRSYLLQQIKAQLARILFGNNGYYAVSSKGDEVVQEAMNLIHGDQYMKLLGR